MAELIKNNKGFKILTDTGWSNFTGISINGVRPCVEITTCNTRLKCTFDHEIFLQGYRKTKAAQLKPKNKILINGGVDSVVSVKLSNSELVYDLVDVEKNHRFYANELLISNCQFISADETLISPLTLATLDGREPIFRQGQIRWYEKPKKGGIYVVGLDPSLGTGSDPAAIQIYEANTTTQIGEWKHNKTDIPSQIKLLAQINKFIVENTGEPNNLYYSVENNAIGEAALVSISEYGESNILGTFIHEKGKKRKGFLTGQKSKLAACAKFKSLLESNKLKINSKALISELKVFVASAGSYAAKIGSTDDLVMSSLLAVRMMQSLGDYYTDLESQIRDHEDIIPPMPFYAIL